METFRNEKVIRSEWIDKKYSHSYKRRFLILTEQHLYITIATKLTQSTGIGGGHDNDRIENYNYNEDDIEIYEMILTTLIQDVILYNDQQNSFIGYFEILFPPSSSATSSSSLPQSSSLPSSTSTTTTTTTTCHELIKLRFRCSIDSASLWVRDIKNLPHSKSTANFYQEAIIKPKSSSRVSTFLKSFNFTSTETPSLPSSSSTYVAPVVMFSIEQAEALQRLYNFISSSTEICVSLIISVFESINRLEKNEKQKAARQLGHALAMWLGETTDTKKNVRRASYASNSGKNGKPSQMEILRAWLEISLLRELEESCHFSPETIYPQAKRHDHRPTGDCRNKSDGGGAAITPLRRDNVESLFLSNFIKGVAVNTGVLSRWLLSPLIRIASDPLSYSVINSKSNDNPEENDTPPIDGQVKIFEECTQMFETMKSSEISLPPSLMLLICIIQKLTDSPQNQSTNEQKESSSSSLESSTPHQDIFYASSCAALFLRLVCPAIISPLEWGALRRSTPTSRQTEIESSRNITLTRNYSTSNMNTSTLHKKSRISFVPSILKKEEPVVHLPEQPTEEEIKSINAMDQNPAVAAIILVAHLLHSTHIDLSEESQCVQLRQLIHTVVRVVPLQKLEIYMQRYEEKSKSIVDPSTQKSFESPHTRKALLTFARSVQKIANLSIVNRQLVEHHAIDSFIRQKIATGDDSRGDDPNQEWTMEMLTESERLVVLQQITASQEVRNIYETIAQNSLPVLHL